jgi:hypothetical protein
MFGNISFLLLRKRRAMKTAVARLFLGKRKKTANDGRRPDKKM